jgi:hypothetical protein
LIFSHLHQLSLLQQAGEIKSELFTAVMMIKVSKAAE